MTQELVLKTGPMAYKGEVAITEIPVAKVKLGRNSRLSVTDEDLAGLMQSIKEVGLLQPVGVSVVGANYELRYGNRRFMACLKLGMKTIPAVVHKTEGKKWTRDLQNLTENLQRTSISFMEAGRYMVLLEKQGLKQPEIAARMGITSGYVRQCLDAYKKIPSKYHKDMVVRTTNSKIKIPGKISINSARAIQSARQDLKLNTNQVDKLYKAAKTDVRFNSDNVHDYAKALKTGKKDILDTDVKIRSFSFSFKVKDATFQRLLKTGVISTAKAGEKRKRNGKYRNMHALCAAIIEGREKKTRFKFL